MSRADPTLSFLLTVSSLLYQPLLHKTLVPELVGMRSRVKSVNGQRRLGIRIGSGIRSQDLNYRPCEAWVWLCWERNIPRGSKLLIHLEAKEVHSG